VPVLSVAFSPDGRCIVSGSVDETVRVWKISTGGTAAGPFTGQTDSANSAAFSLAPDGQCIVSEPRSIHMLITAIGNTVTTLATTRHPNFEFTDHSIINNEGWICGNDGELLMWIPLVHRSHLHRPSNVWVAGEYETRMDLSTFVHGRSWTTCMNV
jgi:hypothetical protein